MSLSISPIFLVALQQFPQDNATVSSTLLQWWIPARLKRAALFLAGFALPGSMFSYRIRAFSAHQKISAS
jgi:hypothetical protein